MAQQDLFSGRPYPKNLLQNKQTNYVSQNCSYAFHFKIHMRTASHVGPQTVKVKKDPIQPSGLCNMGGRNPCEVSEARTTPPCMVFLGRQRMTSLESDVSMTYMQPQETNQWDSTGTVLEPFLGRFQIECYVYSFNCDFIIRIKPKLAWIYTNSKVWQGCEENHEIVAEL
jgi:hypothetical protein